MKEEQPKKRDHPLWETLIMAGSFVLLWAWFVARQTAKTSGGRMWPGWTVIQILAVAVLVLILIRRMVRVRRAFEESRKLPNQFPFMNGHKK